MTASSSVVRITSAAMVLLAIAAAPVLSQAATIRVPDDESTIQAGVDAAAWGDTVLISCGTYHDCTHPGWQGELNCVIINVGGIYLRSETGSPDCVSIDAQGLGRVMECGADSVTIEGITLTGGYSPGPWLPTGAGGGLYCHASGVTVSNVLFEGNEAPNGHGGGVCCSWTSPSLHNVTFIGNSAPGFGKGGGLYTDHSSLALDGCVFESNSGGTGGGSYFGGDGVPQVTNCTFLRNTATGAGAAVAARNTYPHISRCTFAANSCPEQGAAVYSGYCHSGPVEVEDCIVAFNGEGWPFYCDEYGDFDTLRCCVYGNAGGDSLCGTYADMLWVDPRLCDFLSGDLSLCTDSPCLPTNNDWGVQIGALGEGCGACGSPVAAATWTSVKSMYR